MILLHVFFTGMVQGVGFRYTVHRYATALHVNGWVRNLADGRVEMKAEGDRAVLEELIRRIEGHFGAAVRDKTIYWDQHLEHFSDFQIIF